MKKYAIIVAGGSGTRMKSTVPKQFLDLEGDPIIIHTIRRFMEADSTIGLVVVLPEKQLSFWQTLSSRYAFVSSIRIAVGGSSRSESVRSGLREISGEGLVAIHDAVRPFVSSEIINESYKSAAEKGSGVAAVALKDSIREFRENEETVARDRADFVLVQTPQTFKIDLIKQAYAESSGDHSDDATVFERSRNSVYLVPGSYANIKITTPEDLR